MHSPVTFLEVPFLTRFPPARTFPLKPSHQPFHCFSSSSFINGKELSHNCGQIYSLLNEQLPKNQIIIVETNFCFPG